MQGLMIHTDDGHIAGLKEVCAVPLPEATHSYQPVDNGELIEFVHERVDTLLGLDVTSESYGLSRKDQQMFGLMCLDTGAGETGLSIGLRNAYDKSLRVAIASGSNVFV